MLAEWIFWLGIGLVFYTYVGYGILVWILLRFRKNKPLNDIRSANNQFPEVSLLIAAYNEAGIIAEKVKNCQALDYPADRLQVVFVTDGSVDGTPELLRQYDHIRVLHEDGRKGKMAAVERAMAYIQTPITVFTDANTFLNTQAIRELVQYFENPRIGAVAGEKRIMQQTDEAASAAGEGLYWHYESFLKKQDARLYSVVGAAGELYAIRTALFESLPSDTILDDFMQTLLIAAKGYRVAYAPEAFAEEYASADLKEELKRKIRICAGGFQSMARLLPLLNPFRYGWLSFQYVSHRVLRWTLAPLFLPFIFVANAWLFFCGSGWVYAVLFALQCLFYIQAALAYQWRNSPVSIKGFFVPLYFCIMNYSVYAGFLRYISGRQSVKWEKARRAEGV
ncbi:MAG TPA: glycosyltransferase family 2 protein [Saprospiraceae bacterium]|nr:glycosyltransferase family 2 protein [Saprospiraceae bacterium]HMQ82257.1 glycosyltransferase family 2 protein [Saprospiraceae bacterium]